MPEPAASAILQNPRPAGLYGESHAIQGVDLTLDGRVLSLVGRNGMGKTTLCNTIVGLKRARSGSIALAGREIAGLEPHEIARLGVGYVPQGRRVWRSLTVDEHLRARGARRSRCVPGRSSAIYQTFPRLAERRGKRRRAAFRRRAADARDLARAAWQSAPARHGRAERRAWRRSSSSSCRDDAHPARRGGGYGVLVVEQNIGVATAVAENVAIMVNGRINRVMAARRACRRPRPAAAPARRRPARRGRTEECPTGARDRPARVAEVFQVVRGGNGEAMPEPPSAAPIYRPVTSLPNRWSLQRCRASAAASAPPSSPRLPNRHDRRRPSAVFDMPLAERHGRTALVVGTFDTKGRELKFIRDTLRELGIRTRTVDLSTSGKPSSTDVTPQEVASAHPRGAGAPSSPATAARRCRRWRRPSSAGSCASATSAASSPPAAPAARRSPPPGMRRLRARHAEDHDLDRRFRRGRPLCRRQPTS